MPIADQPSPNFDARGPAPVDMLVLHYTGMAREDEALARLGARGAKVSAHYFVTMDARVIRLVGEQDRAWHAGVASWRGASDINARSIGIEISNPGHDFDYPDFAPRQIEALIALCRDILARHAIPARNVVGHSDIAPLRKRDPGEKFPWARLAEAAIGCRVQPCALRAGPVLRVGDTGRAVGELQAGLARYGYGLDVSGHYDRVTQACVAAFQRHFRPVLVDGTADVSTLETLNLLLDLVERI